MESLLETQHQLITAIEQLYSNFKKDGAERKTPDSIKRRLETLQQYWKDFENNHVTLCGYGIRSHAYFTNKQFEQTKERYEHVVSALKNYLVREGKPNPLLKPATFFGEAGNHHLGAEPSTSRPATPGEVIMQPATYTVKGVDSKTDEMLRKQASNFRAFQRTVTSIEIDTVTEKWEFDHLLRTVQSRWSAIDTLHLEIDSELEGRNQEYDQMFYHYEETFNQIIKTINKKMWSVSHREKSTPQMELPTFNGCFQQWTSFKDLFTETIHTNPSLSGAQKMQFLKSKIKGEAERLVQHLQITSDNYSICWDILNHRYNNKKLIFSSHINTLINIPVINQVSFALIKRLHDTSLETLNAIKSLGLDISTWDPLLVHLLAQKLDPDTHNEYIASLKQPRELPILHEFLDFLESKFIALETAKKRQENPGYKTTHNYQDAKQFKKPYFKQSFASNNKVEQSTLNNKNMKPGIMCPVCAVRGHALYCCTKFIEMSPQAKRQYITNNNICKNCLYDHNNKVCFSEKRCKICNAAHNTILHNAFLTNINNKGEALNQTKRSTMGNPEQLHGTSHVSQQSDVPEILLATAIVTIEAYNGSYHRIRALIDQGSQTSLISERTVQALGIPRRMCRGVVSGIGEKESNCKGVVTLHCAATNSDFTFTTEALIMKSLIKNLPSCSFPKPNWPLLKDIQLADPDFNTSKPVDLLLGADVYSDILLDGICRTGPKLPIAQRTRLGWILSGHVEQTLQCNVVLNDISSIQRFWDIEDIESGSELTSTDQTVLDFYQSTTIRREDGRYEVRLPLKRDVKEELGSSKPMAIAQFRQLERKFNNNPTFAIKYKEFMREYLSLGHMTKSVGNETPSYYLPHHGVLRDQSETTKLRTVFNGSAKTDSGKSLNDLMESGPNLQQDLQGIIIKWRQYKIAFTSDIEKFFRQINISQQDQKYQKIIWRDSVAEPLQDYQLTTVTYGTKAAPFLAMMTLRQLAKDERSNYEGSLALEAIETSIYTDDLVYGSHSVESAKLIIKDITSLLQSGGFHLRKWKSNHPNILGAANHDPNQEEYSFKQPDCSAKTLGLGWNPKTDEFTFSLDLHLSKQTTTKRLLLSEISRLFDPLGWLSPITTTLKLLFQQVWQNDLKWDDPLPDNIHKQWVKLNTDINKTKQFKLPRWIGSTENDQIELHGFSDASGKAYACVVYCKITRSGHTSIAMIAGKTRLVPLSKQISLPKLELSGALLLSQLIDKIKHNLPCYDIKIYGWVDSMVVLGWINGDPDRWKTFVSNRVSKIKQVIPAECWRYVKSSENPADCASRGLTASQLKDHKLWWDGPTWLSSYNASYHNETKFNTDQELRKTINIVSVATNQESIINQLLYKYSSLSKVINTLSWIYRFISRDGQRKPPYLTLAELNRTRERIIKQIQQEHFYHEICNLKKGESISNKSQIASLTPFLDKNQLLKVGGRLKNAHISEEMKHPIILPKNCRLSDLIIDTCHELTYHGGPRLTLSIMRQKYWLVGGIRATKKRVSQCVRCRRQNPIKQNQIMGDLPPSRVIPSRPFYHTGVDYTGHVYIKANKGRGIKTVKGYVSVFVCMVTKAVHLELVSDLTTHAFLAALRRMSARRGVPVHMYSDQGTTFIGSSNILQQEYDTIRQTFNEEFISEIQSMSITWHFNAPSWPSAGGLWEAAVKSLKYHLKRVIGEQRLTYEEYSTLLSQLEACLNQRPLCQLTENPEDLNCLTPAHFLTNGPTLAFYSTEIDMRTRWYLTRTIFEGIWKRWSCEYLSQLSSRSKWRQERTNLKVDDIVVIHDANLPAGKWALGRVVQLHPGSDGHVRVVSLKTKTGIMKRPIVKLSILPTNPDKSNEDQQLSINAQKTESNSSQPNEKSRARKTNYSFAKMAFSLLLFIMTLITSTEGAYNITPIQTSQQGLYFDKVANMNVIRDEWRLVVYYDMSPYREGTRALIKYIDYLQKACNPIQTQSYCQAFISQLEHGLNELQHYNNILQNKKLTRQRRGLINGVGNIANSLFGVLDSQFAEKYEQDIINIRKNQAHVALLLKNQTSIVEAEFNVLKRTEQIINKDHKVINERLQTLENAVQGVLSNNAAIADFALSALIANNLLLRLKDIQNTLVDTIADIYNGQLNLHLLTPDQLRQQLILITSQIPNDLLLPIDLANLSTAYHLLKIKASMNSNYLISEVTLPLVSRDNYEIHKVISIPQAINNSNMTYVLPVSSYLAINIKKDAMLLMTQMDFKSCIHKEPDVMLCSLNSPVYHIKDDQNLCFRDPVTRQCKTTLTRCESQWIDLHNINHYFYFCCSSCPMKLLCDVDIIQLNLSNAGIFTTNQGCAVKSKHFTVYTHKQGMTNLYVKPGILTPQISPINHIISIPIPPTNVEPIFSDHDQQMRDIQNQIDTMKQTVPLYSDMSPHDVHHYVISYVIVGILITIAAAFIIHRRCRSQQRQQPAAVAVGMSGAAPAVEIGPQSAAPLRTQGQCSAMCSVSGPSTKSERKDAECVYSKVNRSSSPVLRSFYVVGNNSDKLNSV